MNGAAIRAVIIAAAVAGTGTAQSPRAETAVTAGEVTARFDGPTNRYGHNVLGGLPEWSRLCMETANKSVCVTLPENAVFEDIAPRLADMNGDGQAEVIVVESTNRGGASLVIYGIQNGALTRVSTPPIGRRNRWLAPIGVADFNGDGVIDVAYVEKPHLARILKIWSWAGDHLRPLVSLPGYSNHRIGDSFIQSGIRDCGNGPELVLPNARWDALISVRYAGDWIAEAIGDDPLRGLDAALSCT